MRRTSPSPACLFKSTAALDLASAFDPGLFASFYIGAFAGFALGFSGARYVFHRPATDAVAIGFACMFSNSLLLGLPITERAYGPDALAGNYAIISLHAPMLYALGILVMEMVRSHGEARSLVATTRQILRTTARQPLVIGIAAGFAVNLTGIALPNVALAAVDMIARSAIPTALFGLGGVLFRYRPEGDGKVIAMICAIVLLVHPAITYGLGRFVFALNTDQMRSAVITAAMAPGVNAYLFANIYGVAKRVTASAVLLATAASILTTWGWLHVLP